MSDDALVIAGLVTLGGLIVGMCALAGMHFRWLRVRPRSWRELP